MKPHQSFVKARTACAFYLDAESLQRVPDGVLNIQELTFEVAAVSQMQPQAVCAFRLHMRPFKPTRVHDMRQPQSIRCVRLIALRRHCGSRMTRLDADNRQT